MQETNELKLQYEVRPHDQPDAVYEYYGERIVYSATGVDAKKQKSDFTVKESSATAVA